MVTEVEQDVAVAISKKDEECTAEEKKLRALERIKCESSFAYFLRYCKVTEPPTQDNPGGIIPFKLWSHIKEAIRALTTQKLIVWLKSRQVGASWLIAAYVLWFAMMHEAATVGLFSKGEGEAFFRERSGRNSIRHLSLLLPWFFEGAWGYFSG